MTNRCMGSGTELETKCGYTCHMSSGEKTSKLHKPWQGPCAVVKVLGHLTYKIQSVSERNGSSDILTA